MTAYVPPPHTRLEDLVEIPAHGGRWHFPYSGGEDGGEYSSIANHEWQMAPTDAPASRTDHFYGRPRTIYYDPTRTEVTPGEFRHEYTNKGNRVTDLNPPAGMLWRGMSDEEYQAAVQSGYFESPGEYNVGGDAQVGKTYFTTGPDHAESYANSFAPWQFTPTFTRPGHIIGIPDRPDIPREGGHEVGISGRIPFDEVVHHYVGHPYAIVPGSYRGVSNKYDGEWDREPPYRSQSANAYLEWEDASPARTIQAAYARQRWAEGGRYFFAYDTDYNGQTTHLTGEDMDSLQWDWDRGRWVPRPSGEDRLVPAREERNFNYEGRWPGWERNASRRLTAVWDYVDVPEEERGDWDDEDWENYHAEVDAGGLKPTKGEYPIVDQIHDEFNDWWDKGGTPGKNYDPDALDDGVKRGPIGHWPTVENFLKDRYPAAYRGLGYGWEEAKAVLDGEDIYRFPQGITNYRGYETGQDAIDRHGYDPKEVASAMMYLHNLSRGIDGSYDHHRGEDGARLWNIFQKRLKMQRAVTAHLPDADLAGIRHRIQQQQKDASDKALIKWDKKLERWVEHTAARLAMPWYHTSEDRLPVGTRLIPGGGRSWVPRPHGDDRLVPDREDKPFDYDKRWPGWTRERQAMAWDEWAPKIKGGCQTCTDGWEGRYTIPQAGAFLNYAHATHQGQPAVKVIGIYTHPSDRGDGVAEALMRRLADDHPGAAIIPGMMTTDGQHFHDRMLDKEPTARDRVTARAKTALNQQLVDSLYAQKRFQMQRDYEQRQTTASHRIAVNQELLNKIEQEFNEWAGPNGSRAGIGPYPRYLPGHWPYMERFFKEKYPAVYRGLDMGREEAGPKMKYDAGTCPDCEGSGFVSYGIEPEQDWCVSCGGEGEIKNQYETGPEAVSKYGYDPKEIAAAGLVLHIGTGNTDVPDKVLNDIAQKRFQMQRDYEQRTKTAMPDGFRRVWYHASPHDLPPGTLLTPGGGEANYDYESWAPGEGRHDHVWVTDDLDNAEGWAGVSAWDSPARKGHLYEVVPTEEPQEWDDEGHVVPSARIIRRIKTIDNGPHTAQRTAMPTWYHLTNDPDFKLDPSKHPNRPYGLGEWERPGVFLTQRPGEWAYSEDDDSWSGDRPYIADIDAPDNLHELPGVWYDPDGDRPTDKLPGSEETFVPADQFHHLTIQKIRPRKTVDEVVDYRTANSLLVGPEDAYDEWDWFKRHYENPPSSIDVTTKDWYHVSPHRMPVGTVLAPMRGDTPWNDSPYDHGLENRANWVWVEFDKDKARRWMHYVLQHQPECYIYRVEPELGPFAWNGTADEGWVTTRAKVTEYLDRLSRDVSFQEMP